MKLELVKIDTLSGSPFYAVKINDMTDEIFRDIEPAQEYFTKIETNYLSGKDKTEVIISKIL